MSPSATSFGGDVIAEIETDKATMEVEAVDDGILASIMVAEGSEGVAVGTPIGRLAEDGESLDDATAAPASAARPASGNSSGTRRSTWCRRRRPPRDVAPVQAATPAVAQANRIFASPLARRIAADRGVDLASLSGSGPHGRILRRDVEAAETAPAAVRPAADQAVVQGASTLEPNSQMRRIIASRLQESKQTAPHFYLTVDCEIDAAFRQAPDERPGAKV